MADLRQHKLAVDSPDTGFAFVLRELLHANGVADSEVTIVRGGATELRFQGLVAGSYDATLLRTPFDILAAERGFHVLATADSLGPYLGTTGMVRRSWARSHESTLIGFLRAYRSAMQWLGDPANRSVAEALLVANIRDMTPALATRAAETLLAERGGLLRNLEIDPQRCAPCWPCASSTASRRARSAMSIATSTCRTGPGRSTARKRPAPEPTSPGAAPLEPRASHHRLRWVFLDRSAVEAVGRTLASMSTAGA